MKKYFAYFLFLLLASHFAFAATKVKLTAEIDRTQVAVDESFQLILTINQKIDNPPNIKALEKNFSILGRSKSTSLTMINGKTTTLTKWIYILAAKHQGSLSIPKVCIKDHCSQSLSIQAQDSEGKTKQSHNKNAFLDTYIEDKKPYVQSQTIYKVRLYYAAPIRNGTLTDPQSNDAVIMLMGSDKRYQARRHGLLYHVLERDYAIFPQKSGHVVIQPPTFTGLMQQKRHYHSQMDFFTMPSGIPIRLLAKEIVLNVKGIPKKAQLYTWLPTHHLSLQESWSGNQHSFRVGDPITRTIIIKAEGLTASQLPDITSENYKGVNVYPDKAISNDKLYESKIVAERTQKIAYIPTQSGKISLPAIKIHWFNTKTHHLETAKLSARTLHILPAIGQARTESNLAQPIDGASFNAQKPVSTPTTIAEFWPERVARFPSLLPESHDAWTTKTRKKFRQE